MTPGLIDELRERHVHFTVMHHAPAYTAIQEAVSVGAPAAGVLKTVLLDTAEGHVLAVVPANRHLSLRRIHDVLGDKTARVASELEIEQDFPTVELGALPPFGSLLGIPVLVDPEVLAHPVAVFAASREASIRGPIAELFDGENVTIARITFDGPPLVMP